MANKRNVDCVDALICSKMPRRDNKPDQLPNGICKPTPLASYSQENSVQYTGSYLAYHLRNQERTDPSGAWSQSQPYLQVAGEPSAQPQPVGDRLHQAEPEAQSPRSTSMKDQLDLVKELMIVRSKWVTFVERQKNLRSDQSRSGVLCPASTGKHNLTGSDLGAGQSCRNVAFPQAVYRSSICCSGVGCSLQNSDHFHRRGQETEWRMPTPVTSRCLIANNDHLLHNQQYGNSLSKNKLLHHGSNIGQASSVGRITKDAEAQSSLGHGFGPYNGNVLQDPRYSLLPYESANGTVPSHTSMPTFQSPPLHVYSKGQKEQAPFYCDKRTPPKFPIPIQPKVVHSHNATLNAAPYSLLHPRGYRAQPVGCPYPVRGVVGQMPVSNSTFVPQLSPGNPYPPQSESLGYPIQPHLLHNSAPTTGPSIHPNLETVPQPGQLGLQSPSIRNLSAAPQDPASANTPSLDTLCCRLRGVGDAQMDTPCYNSLTAPPNKEYIGHPQLISKHSAFQPVLSGKPFKGPFERPAVSLADQRPKDIYTHEFNPSTDISPNCNHGTSAFSKENEITNSMLVDCELGSPPTSYSISPSGRTSEVNFLSAHSSEAHKRLSASSPPMPVINNVFSLAPYRSYLEATGLFFTSCQKCQSDCNKPLSCSCPSESQTNLCGTAAFANADLHEESPMKLTQVIDELQCKDAELKQSNPSVCSGACSKETLSRKKREGGQPNPAASLDQDVNLSPTLGIQNPTPRPIASYQVDNDDPAGKLEMTKADAESVLDLSVKSRSQSVQPQFSASPGRGEEPECMGKELGSTGERSEKLENKGESTRHGGGPRSEVGDTRPAPPSVPCKPGEEINSKEVSNEDKENTAGSVNRKESEAHLESSGATAVKTTTSSCSPLTVALNRCEVLRPAPTRVERSSLSRLPEGPADMNMITVLGSVNPLRLIVPLELVVPDEAKSVLSPTPEVKKSSCETKVHIPSWGEPAQSAGDMHTSFLALHQSLCCMVAQSVAETPAEDLQARLRDFEARSRSKEDPKARSSSKSKNGPRNEASKSQEMWLGYGQVAPTMRKLLSQLETYLFTRMCPFPHVIRAGATFIPIYLVKEKLFSSLKGTAIDQVFQEHKIELRPTTLSEEKKLQNELQLQRCSSRLIKLLSLKQLPEIYPDLLNVLWYSCAKIRLGLQEDENLKKTAVIPTPADESSAKSLADPGSAGKKKAQKETPAARPGEKHGEPSPGAKLRKRRKRGSAAALASSNPARAHPASGSPSGPRANSSSVDRSEAPCFSGPAGDAALPTEPRPVPPKLQKSTTEEFLEKRALAKSDFEKKGSALVVKLNRVVIKNDDKGTAIPYSVKIEGSQIKGSQIKGAQIKGAQIKGAQIKGAQIKGSQMPIKKRSTALRPTRSTSKMLHLRDSIVRLKFEKFVQTARKRNLVLKPTTTRKSLFTRGPQQLWERKSLRLLSRRKHQDEKYPNLVGKRIRHLYEENDKSESWYKGVVLRVYEKHQNPLKTVFEVKYDSEPDWQYYLELLQDYEKGWLRVDN